MEFCYIPVKICKDPLNDYVPAWEDAYSEDPHKKELFERWSNRLLINRLFDEELEKRAMEEWEKEIWNNV